MGAVTWILYAVIVWASNKSRVGGQPLSCSAAADYDPSIRPNSTGAPVDVSLHFYIESMGTIKESTMVSSQRVVTKSFVQSRHTVKSPPSKDFTMTLFFRQFWHDSRLVANASVGRDVVNFKGDRMSTIWTPDVFFLYEKESTFHDVTVPNRMIRLYPNGTVLMSTRVSVTLSCNMDLARFPMDTQECQMIMMSYTYNSNEMILTITNNSLEIDADLQIPRFQLDGYKTDMTEIGYGPTGNYSVARVIFSFSRHLQSYILTVYIPSSLIVVIAWLSFWIDAKAAPARVSLGITTVLTITTMTAGMQETMPLVTYAKALDVWLTVCLVFVFSSLMEYACANYLVILENKRKLKNYTKKLGNGINEKVDHLRVFEFHYGLGVARRPGYREPLTADKLDRICRYSFPVVFALFNAIYWPVYLKA
ncbi:glycine receptor subunit alpha-3-like isoform X2 [Acanthaster planci]|uniref:Glycine receptor subunit alpha-3-like isoform X2 n=1 Tax=Acanthaster planci TaxID=133434 RepID=A0A8B7ZQN6_ACAPL|nr:glycine receptor subunit alpha-3-like isoform X2 [Acanthaster planci]